MWVLIMVIIGGNFDVDMEKLEGFRTLKACTEAKKVFVSATALSARRYAECVFVDEE